MVSRLERLKESSKVGLAVKIGAPEGRFLRDQDELAHPRVGEARRFVEDRRKRLANVTTADVRNRAVGAEAIAAVGDLEVGDVRRCKGQALRVVEDEATRGMIEESSRGGLFRREDLKRGRLRLLRRIIAPVLREEPLGDLPDKSFVVRTDPRVDVRITLRQFFPVGGDRATRDDQSLDRARSFRDERFSNVLFRFLAGAA